MVKDIDKAKRARARIKGQVTRIETFLSNNLEITVAETRVRLKKLDEFYKTFEEIQQDVESYIPTDAALVEAFEAENDEERQLFDERYYDVAARLQSVIDTEQEAQVQRFQIATAGQNVPSIQQERPARESQPKLPELKLSEFSGKYTDWMVFKNTLKQQYTIIPI